MWSCEELFRDLLKLHKPLRSFRPELFKLFPSLPSKAPQTLPALSPPRLPQSSSTLSLKALLEVECMLRPLPRFFVNCIQIKRRKMVVVDVRESLCRIMVDVNVLRRHLQLVTLNSIKVFPVRALLVELVHVVVEVQLVLGVRMQKLRRLLDLLLASSVMCHVVDSLSTRSTRSTRDHWIPLTIAASVIRR